MCVFKLICCCLLRASKCKNCVLHLGCEVVMFVYLRYVYISFSVDPSNINGRVFSIDAVNPPLREAIARSTEEFFHPPSYIYSGG